MINASNELKSVFSFEEEKHTRLVYLLSNSRQVLKIF